MARPRYHVNMKLNTLRGSVAYLQSPCRSTHVGLPIDGAHPCTI
jgi:hypothetical protein